MEEDLSDILKMMKEMDLEFFEWPDGDRYEGTWKHGSRYGPGRFVSKSGKIVQQNWREPPHSNYAEFMPEKFPPSDDSDERMDLD